MVHLGQRRLVGIDLAAIRQRGHVDRRRIGDGEVQADQPAAGRHLAQRFDGGTAHALGPLEQVDQGVVAPVDLPQVPAPHRGPGAAQGAGPAQRPAPFHAMHPGLRPGTVQGHQAIAQAAAGIQHARALGQGNAVRQAIQRAGRRREHRRIAPGIQGIDQQHHGQWQQPQPGGHGPGRHHQPRQRKAQGHHQPPPPGGPQPTARQAQQRCHRQRAPPRGPLLQHAQTCPGQGPHHQGRQGPDQPIQKVHPAMVPEIGRPPQQGW